MKTMTVTFPSRVHRGVATKDGKLFYVEHEDDDFHFIRLPKWVEKAISERDTTARKEGMRINHLAIKQALGFGGIPT